MEGDVPDAPYDARAVSNFILDVAEKEQRAITQMALLKLLYFAHGWYLAETAKPLILQPVEAWKYGPVVKVVRDAFKHFERRPITSRAERLVLDTGQFIIVEPRLSISDEKFVKFVYQAYVTHRAWSLSEMTHEPGSPWDKLWNTENSVGRLGLRIKNDEIRQHFLSMSKPFTLQ